MKRLVRLVVILACIGIATYGSIFLIAELFTEVVILRTYDSDGSPHETRVTVIDRDGLPWVRGRPYRGWFRRIEANPDAELYRNDRWQGVQGFVSRDPADAAAFDRVMFESYGVAYRYVDLIARLSATEVPVRLELATPQAGGPP